MTDINVESQIVAFIAKKGKARWSDVHEELVGKGKCAKATFLKYFDNAKAEKKVLKQLDEDGRVYYCINPDFYDEARNLKFLVTIPNLKEVQFNEKELNIARRMLPKELRKMPLSKSDMLKAKTYGTAYLNGILKGLKIRVASNLYNEFERIILLEKAIKLLSPVFFTKSTFDKYLSGGDLSTIITLDLDGDALQEEYKRAKKKVKIE